MTTTTTNAKPRWDFPAGDALSGADNGRFTSGLSLPHEFTNAIHETARKLQEKPADTGESCSFWAYSISSLEKAPSPLRVSGMKLVLPTRTLTWPRRGCVMAILNINDDSFSGDGKVDSDWAVARAIEMIGEGADIIDIGAESARTNREAITIEEEARRFASFCERWPEVITAAQPRDAEQVWPPVLSANTWRPEVIAAVLPMGVELVNDMSGLPDSQNAILCVQARAALLVMHSVGAPKVDHSHVRWRDIMGAMEEFFTEKITQCEAAGLTADQLILDPGFGFAKSPTDDLTVLNELARLSAFQRPLLLPVGRKGFIGETLGIEIPAERDAATLACVAAGHSRGASIYRVHEVKGCHEVLKVLAALDEQAKASITD